MTSRRMTVRQALVEFLANQWTVDGDSRERTHPRHVRHLRPRQRGRDRPGAQQSHVTGPGLMPYHQARNEQAMVHQAVGYARMHRRRGDLRLHRLRRSRRREHAHRRGARDDQPAAGAAAAGDTFATRARRSGAAAARDAARPRRLSVNDAFRPVSRFFDRVSGPSSCPRSLLGAMRVLTDPAETGAVTHRAAAGRAGRGVRLSRWSSSQPREWHLAPAAARARRARPRASRRSAARSGR